jgi:hypothetical protein
MAAFDMVRDIQIQSREEKHMKRTISIVTILILTATPLWGSGLALENSAASDALQAMTSAVALPAFSPYRLHQSPSVPVAMHYDDQARKISGFAGLGLAALGVYLVASSSDSASITTPGFGTTRISVTRNGRRYGGIMLIGGGAALAWWGFKGD